MTRKCFVTLNPDKRLETMLDCFGTIFVHFYCLQEKVFVKVMFLKVGEIRTVEEDFKADILLQCRWREKELDGTHKNVATSILTACKLYSDLIVDLFIQGKSFELKKPGKYWNPQLKIENLVCANHETVWHQVSFSGRGQAYICEKRRIRGRFEEQMELHEFPFDTQV